MHIPQLISDLAIMMLTAGIITIAFKKIKQPLILGYILAGFLLSPYFPWFSTVVDTESISTWSEIGIVFFMFHLGLEFNMHKLAEVGSTAILTCIVNLAGMMAIGYPTGIALGFSTVDAIVLGGMLSMSSTMVLIKIFEEKKNKENYQQGVFGTLVIQDIMGIFMMVILSTVAVSKGVSGMEMAIDLSTMLLYLVIWLVLGIYFLPTFFDKTIKYMNDEMLTIVSIGICLGMVLLANFLGFSSALGAFLAGSLLAGTVHVERVEHITKPIKDIFGAVFFISVGMMVSPQMIVKYAIPILVIAVVTIIGKSIFNTLGMLVSGQTLDNSIKSGFALAQIGEFAFIIAGLGRTLGVIDDFLYPVMVAVSVITTVTTPMVIKVAPSASGWLEKALPVKLRASLNKYTSSDQADQEKDADFYTYIRKYFLRIAVFGGLMLTFALVLTFTFEPWVVKYIGSEFSIGLTIVATYVVIAVFAGPLLNLHNSLYTMLWLKGRVFRLPLTVMNIIKYVIIVAIAMIPLRVFFTIDLIWLGAIMAVLLILISRKSFFATWYLKLETRFLKNFNERLLEEEERKGHKEKWLDEMLHIFSIVIPEGKDYVGKNLDDLNWSTYYKVFVVKIKRGDKQYILPNGEFIIKKGDKVYIIGDKRACENFYKAVDIQKNRPLRTLKEFMATGYEDINHALAICPIKLTGEEWFAGKSIKQGNIRHGWHCFIIGMQKDGYPIIMPDPNLAIDKDDIIWIMGSNNALGRVISEYL